jgi:hypothetical protein
MQQPTNNKRKRRRREWIGDVSGAYGGGSAIFVLGALEVERR